MPGKISCRSGKEPVTGTGSYALWGSLLTGFSDTADTYIDFGNFIPGRIVYDTGLGKVENTLEGTDGIGSGRAIDAVGGDFGDSRVILGNPV